MHCIGMADRETANSGTYAKSVIGSLFSTKADWRLQKGLVVQAVVSRCIFTRATTLLSDSDVRIIQNAKHIRN